MFKFAQILDMFIKHFSNRAIDSVDCIMHKLSPFIKVTQFNSFLICTQISHFRNRNLKTTKTRTMRLLIYRALQKTSTRQIQTAVTGDAVTDRTMYTMDKINPK